jgi:DNA-binding NarL/FixJ family response regulator
MDRLRPTVVLADDSSEILTGVSKFLSRQFTVVACALNGEQAVNAVLELQPDVVVLDIQMPQLNGLQAARRLQAAGSPTRIVFLTGLEDADLVSSVLNLGPHSYVFKMRLYEDLPTAIFAAMAGEVFCSSRQADEKAAVC